MWEKLQKSVKNNGILVKTVFTRDLQEGWSVNVVLEALYLYGSLLNPTKMKNPVVFELNYRLGNILEWKSRQHSMQIGGNCLKDNQEASDSSMLAVLASADIWVKWAPSHVLTTLHSA